MNTGLSCQCIVFFNPHTTNSAIIQLCWAVWWYKRLHVITMRIFLMSVFHHAWRECSVRLMFQVIRVVTWGTGIAGGLPCRLVCHLAAPISLQSCRLCLRELSRIHSTAMLKVGMTEEAWNYLPPMCFIYRDISFLFMLHWQIVVEYWHVAPMHLDNLVTDRQSRTLQIHWWLRWEHEQCVFYVL